MFTAFTIQCEGEDKEEIIKKTVSGDIVVSEITDKINPSINFTNRELVSLLYYLGYLTILEEDFGMVKLGIPNKIMKEIYADYFMTILKDKIYLEKV